MNTSVDASDQELEVLENIYAQRDHVRQRDLARIAGLSLGMTNAIVKRLVQKGWLTIRKVNNRNIRYAVSADGIDQITRRSYRYLKRTIRNIVYYREAIERFVRELKGHGYTGIMLIGASDLDFIVEHACEMYAVSYLRNDREAAERASVQRATLEPASSADRPAEGDGRGRAPNAHDVHGTASRGNAVFLLYSESYIPDAEEKARGANVAFLQDVVSGESE